MKKLIGIAVVLLSSATGFASTVNCRLSGDANTGAGFQPLSAVAFSLAASESLKEIQIRPFDSLRIMYPHADGTGETFSASLTRRGADLTVRIESPSRNMFLAIGTDANKQFLGANSSISWDARSGEFVNFLLYRRVSDNGGTDTLVARYRISCGVLSNE